MKVKTTARREYEKASQGAIAKPMRISLKFWIIVNIATIRSFISKRIARLWFFKLWEFFVLDSLDAFNFENFFPSQTCGGGQSVLK
jgi:hypothetical protein